MSKLWQTKNVSINKEIERFTVGTDYMFDRILLSYDCLGSLAHIKMLQRIGLLKPAEYQKLKQGITDIYRKSEKGVFPITIEDEDCHTAIENYLTKKYKNIGKKVHTGRSRNDQVLTALRLYEKENLIIINAMVLECALSCLKVAKANEFVPIPGYTHFQKAMPSSIGLLFSAYTESFIDDFAFLMASYDLLDSSPLGSAAGYGVNLPIDREYVSELLGFQTIQNNVLYVQNSRGKFELSLIHGINNIALTINKISSDFMLFNTSEFGFFSLPDDFITGSSIMAQKKNPDVFEILRGKSNNIKGYYDDIASILKNLPSGYHRDYQLIKEPLMNCIMDIGDLLSILNLIIDKIVINKDNCIKGMSNEIYSADRANDMVLKGLAFRDAYNISKNNLYSEVFDPIINLKSKTHIGAPGNLNLKEYYREIEVLWKINKSSYNSFNLMKNKLLK